MCVNDWRLGRLTVSNAVAFSPSLATGLVGQSNRQRVGLMFCGNTAMPSTAGFLVTFSGGMQLSFYGVANFMSLTLAEHGSFIQQSFVISGLGVGAGGAWVETMLPEAYLAAGLKQFESEVAKAGVPGY